MVCDGYNAGSNATNQQAEKETVKETMNVMDNEFERIGYANDKRGENGKDSWQGHLYGFPNSSKC